MFQLARQHSRLSRIPTDTPEFEKPIHGRVARATQRSRLVEKGHLPKSLFVPHLGVIKKLDKSKRFRDALGTIVQACSFWFVLRNRA